MPSAATAKIILDQVERTVLSSKLFKNKIAEVTENNEYFARTSGYRLEVQLSSNLLRNCKILFAYFK